MKLPKSLTTVTPFSKLLALSMFILFPIIGFFLGMQYQKVITQAPLQNTYLPHSLPSQTPHNEYLNPTEAAKSQPIHEGKMCTMEAKQCPDGSYVGRSGPNCEFAACPK